MGTDNYILCDQCRQKLHMSSGEPSRIYAAETDLNTLASFLDEHRYHPLRFLDRGFMERTIEDPFEYVEVEACKVCGGTGSISDEVVCTACKETGLQTSETFLKSQEWSRKRKNQ